MSQRSKKAQAKSSKSGRSQVNVRTTPELLARIDEARIDTSRSEFIVQAIEAYLGIEPASPQTSATVQSLVDAAVAQAVQGMTHTLEQRLKVLESRLSALDVDFAVDAAIDEVSLGVVDERVDSGDAPVEEVGSVSVDQPVDALVDSGDAPVDSVDDAPDDAVEGEELATSGEPGLEEATGGDRHVSQESEVGVDAPVDSVDDAADDAVEGEELATSGGSGLEEATVQDRNVSQESKRSVDQSVDSVDDAVEGEELATSGDLGLEEATVQDRNRSQESEPGVDQAFDYRTHGLSGKELAKRLSVSPSSITSNRQKKGTNAFAKWTSQQDPDGLAWNHKKGRYYPDEPKG